MGWLASRDRKVIANVEAGLQEAIQAAKERGDLKAVIQRQAALGLFQNEGIFPAADFLKDDTHAEAARAIRRANAGLMAAYGEVIHYDHAIKQDRQLVRFQIPRTAKKWQSFRLERVGPGLRVFIDGKEVVDKCQVPNPLRAECNACIGAWNGIADFQNLEITQIVVA